MHKERHQRLNQRPDTRDDLSGLSLTILYLYLLSPTSPIVDPERRRHGRNLLPCHCGQVGVDALNARPQWEASVNVGVVQDIHLRGDEENGRVLGDS